ncbi:MAG TPA: fasciclin domain-containing protein [Chloroflexota bacterium]|nr:fasciclin domain-containing protein [Chloroflexota bacterium]
MKRITFFTLLLVFTLFLAACGGTTTTETATATTPAQPTTTAVVMPTEEPEVEEMAGNSIVDIAVGDGRFTTLVTAVTAAGLAETLAGDGPFTVFAPTDDAFAALPEGTIEALLADPQGALTDVLLYHVVSGAVPAEAVVGLDSATTINGEDVAIAVQDGNVRLNESATVIITDIMADNGVIHVIDAVLLPPSMAAEEKPSIAEIAVENGNFTTLVAALEAAGLVDTLAGEGSFTVFAPTDAAFAALPEGTVEALLADPQGALTQILTYHVVDGAVYAADVVNLSAAPTLQGEEIAITVEGSAVYLNDSVAVITTDIEASNGVIHVIDAVLIPPTIAAAMAEEAAMMAEPGTIAEIAAEAGTFNTLLAALEAAGLAETFAGEGAFTVFAPTDDAFAALPEGTIEALLADPNGALTDILLYHVVDGTVPAETVVTLDAATTLLGEDVTITLSDGRVLLNDTVEVIATDIVASNGIIHVIDAVLLPPGE